MTEIWAASVELARSLGPLHRQNAEVMDLNGASVTPLCPLLIVCHLLNISRKSNASFLFLSALSGRRPGCIFLIRQCSTKRTDENRGVNGSATNCDTRRWFCGTGRRQGSQEVTCRNHPDRSHESPLVSAPPLSSGHLGSCPQSDWFSDPGDSPRPEDHDGDPGRGCRSGQGSEVR